MSRPLRLALFCDRFPELSETFVSGEVRELRRQGVDVTVYARPPGVRDPNWTGDVPVQRLDTPTAGDAKRFAAVARLASDQPRRVVEDLHRQRTWKRAEMVTPLRRFAPALRRLARERPDHVHVHFAAEAALDALRAETFTGIPYSVTAHAYEIFHTPANLAAKLERAQFVTVPCAYNVAALAAAGARTDHVHVRMLGTDPDRFARSVPYPEEGVTLAVGRLIEKKGFHVLVDAAAQRDIGPVRIVGEGPWRGRLEALIADRGVGDRVFLAGAAAPERVRRWMEEAALLVVPSVVAANGDRDALPVVIWEALAMELPVVGTSVAGIPEVILPPWGHVVVPDDPDALGAAIAATRAAPYERRTAAGRAGRAWLASEHRQDQAVGRLVELIERS